MTTLFHKVVVAKKQHECFFCRRTIRPREKYVRTSFVRDGVEGYKMHERCESEYLRRLESMDEMDEYISENQA